MKQSRLSILCLLLMAASANEVMVAASDVNGNQLQQVQQADKIQVTGVIVDTNGEPLVGVSVLEVGTTNGTISDFDGKFVLSVIPQNNALTVSFKVTFTDNGGTVIATKEGITGDLAIIAESAWKAGQVYNYQVKINPEDVNKDLKKIEFESISVDTWSDSSNQPGEIQESIPQQ